MRSLLIKSSIILFFILAMGGGLTLASASSEPGMFLYPLKQTTQRITGAFENASGNELPAIGIPQNTIDGGSVAPEGVSPADMDDDRSQDVESASTKNTGLAAPGAPGEGKKAIIPAPASAHAVDQIAATAEPVGHAQPDTGIIGNSNSDPGSSQPDTSGSDGQNDSSPDIGRPQDDLNGDQPGDSSGDSSDSEAHPDGSNPAQPDDSNDDGHHDNSPDSDQHDDQSSNQSGGDHENRSSHDSSDND